MPGVKPGAACFVWRFPCPRESADARGGISLCTDPRRSDHPGVRFAARMFASIARRRPARLLLAATASTLPARPRRESRTPQVGKACAASNEAQPFTVYIVLVRLLAGSVVLAWPALFAADYLPSDGLLNGKADDLVTGGVVVWLVLGLLVTGWLEPLWPALVATLLLGLGVPVLDDALRYGGSSSFTLVLGALCAFVGMLLVVGGAALRIVARSSSVSFLPRRTRALWAPSE